MNLTPINFIQRRLAGAVFVCALGACSTVPDSQTQTAARTEALCVRDQVSIRTDFPVGGQHGCALREDGFALTVWPEAAVDARINPSPWYAFSVEGNEEAAVNITLDYGSHRHRYAPWIKSGDSDWRKMEDAQVDVRDEGRVAVLTVPASDHDQMVAGLPIVSVADTDVWTREIAERHGLEVVEYGQSIEGRSLTALTAGPEDAGSVVIAMTRQHPPELNGAIAFEAFVEKVVARLGEPSFANTRFVFFPMLNPDGVENGYWRHNMGGVDLNRDWFSLKQPEIRTAEQLIQREAAGKDMLAFLDFHSTWSTLVYFHPFNTPDTDSTFPMALKAALDEAFEPSPDWISSHNDGKGTSKNWALQTFRTPGMTIELGDGASRSEAERVGEITADTLFEVFFTD